MYVSTDRPQFYKRFDLNKDNYKNMQIKGFTLKEAFIDIYRIVLKRAFRGY